MPRCQHNSIVGELIRIRKRQKVDTVFWPAHFGHWPAGFGDRLGSGYTLTNSGKMNGDLEEEKVKAVVPQCKEACSSYFV
jgi:hypothetical protein